MRYFEGGGDGNGNLPMNLVLNKALTSPATTTAGSTVTWTLTPSNSGDTQAAAGLSVVEVPPPGLTITAMSGPGYTCDVAALTCTNGSALAPKATAGPISVTAKLADGFTGTAKNVAYVKPAPNDSPETNPLGTPPTTSTNTSASPTDNDDEASVRVTPKPTPTPTPTVVPTGPAPTQPAPGGGLADTGVDDSLTPALALGGLLAGAASLLLGRRRS
ncbi:LPXTG cell wall anchor domain-containing protein [Mariniluteicoccus flavus]